MKVENLKDILLREKIPKGTYNILEEDRYILGESGLVLWKEGDFFVVAYVDRNEHDIILKTEDEEQAVKLFLEEKSDSYPRLKKYLEK